MTANNSAAESGYAQTRGFHPLHTNKFLGSVRPGLAAWSPMLDLIVVATTHDNVHLYRINGQRVWAVSHRLGSDVQVQHFCWRPDGKMLAIAYSDGSTRIHDVNNGKPIHCIVSETPGFGQVSCLGWFDNREGMAATRRLMPPQGSSEECSMDSLFDLDIAAMLPRLSALGSSAGPESTFSSKATLDSLINNVSKSKEGNVLDILVIADENGNIIINIFESFLIGTMSLSSLCHQLTPGSKLIRQAATRDLTTQALLLSESGTGKLLFSTMDILFIQQFGRYLFQLASTSTRAQSLIKYMRETMASIETEFKTMNDLQQKYINIIAEDAEKAGSNVSLEFFEFLVTAGPSPYFKEWLMDTLGERGQKRWEKSSITGYETLRKLVHENLLPTCERLSLCFSRLRGLARWKESGSPLGLEADDFTRCLEVVSAITFFAHEFLMAINRELDHYKAFMNWLRHALDQLATIINIDDKPAEDPQVDTLKVMEYCEKYVAQSSLLPFMKRGTEPGLNSYKERGENIGDLYSKNKAKDLPGLTDLNEYLENLCKAVFAKPQQSMRQQVRLSKPILFSEDEIIHKEMWMVDNGKKAPLAYMFLYPGNQEEAKYALVVRTEIKTFGGLSSASKICCAKVAIPKDLDLQDVRFIDDNSLIMVLYDKRNKSGELMSADYINLEFDDGFIPYKTTESLTSYSKNLKMQKMSQIAVRSYEGNKWTPSQVVVNGSERRRIGCVIATDKMNYTVFDLDHDEYEEEETEEEADVDTEEEGTMEMDDE
ncbi:anaphase-promoting complex, cyclosome, subunit 4-domain-containing protein [Pyronema domesticum]|uniref:Anaphase-promoting complex subunit 4 n=1 Tax=Pyronema omphalodes (strain CBS 100304) TaxID=1076935 RepID=U4L6F0_PYROM|nr:anaphase-promoting complex, cyclosome, subunit 4-domain-containing protein [Pyronema domesticum]CCX08006.1 Similar to Anaphase-promoting complex subunit 4; acc. no. O42839 [Pyronema omphalodes CBS 100304]